MISQKRFSLCTCHDVIALCKTRYSSWLNVLQDAGFKRMVTRRAVSFTTFTVSDCIMLKFLWKKRIKFHVSIWKTINISQNKPIQFFTYKFLCTVSSSCLKKISFNYRSLWRLKSWLTNTVYRSMVLFTAFSLLPLSACPSNVCVVRWPEMLRELLDCAHTNIFSPFMIESFVIHFKLRKRNISGRTFYTALDTGTPYSNVNLSFIVSYVSVLKEFNQLIIQLLFELRILQTKVRTIESSSNREASIKNNFVEGWSEFSFPSAAQHM